MFKYHVCTLFYSVKVLPILWWYIVLLIYCMLTLKEFNKTYFDITEMKFCRVRLEILLCCQEKSSRSNFFFRLFCLMLVVCFCVSECGLTHGLLNLLRIGQQFSLCRDQRITWFPQRIQHSLMGRRLPLKTLEQTNAYYNPLMRVQSIDWLS